MRRNNEQERKKALLHGGRHKLHESAIKWWHCLIKSIYGDANFRQSLSSLFQLHFAPQKEKIKLSEIWRCDSDISLIHYSRQLNYLSVDKGQTGPDPVTNGSVTLFCLARLQSLNPQRLRRWHLVCTFVDWKHLRVLVWWLSLKCQYLSYHKVLAAAEHKQ